ncbi:alpha/beta fold hydrolase [Hymenobacter sp. HMF4947]|uniref:Alpha/beta fold hydrolase n=1 Tax=Hymenobacter ginkgonis TaxID=2682976 RepID=A0A7K1TAH4_9BACT|nr:alpha/beta hydrolase [Hymenobacter ginkgonis]MVN75407.1 alpha/beta fold hydrolase [Hymenobacter ginkgonis]
MVRFGVLLLLLLLQTASAWALKPVAKWWAKPDTLGLKYQDLTLTTPDHVHLAAWLIAPAATAPTQHTTIVMAGGDSGNMASLIYPAAALAAAGYQVLLFDYRGFGHSDAFAINQDYLYYPEFTTDLRTALAEARRRAPRQRVGVLGFSMGTIAGSEAAATTQCDFLLTVGYVASPQKVVAYYQRTRPERPVLLPADAATYSQVAPQVQCPWLFIAGTEDKVTTLADSMAVARAARRRQRREVLPIKGDHMGSMMVFSDDEATTAANVQAVGRFLAGQLAAGKG